MTEQLKAALERIRNNNQAWADWIDNTGDEWDNWKNYSDHSDWEDNYEER